MARQPPPSLSLPASAVAAILAVGRAMAGAEAGIGNYLAFIGDTAPRSAEGAAA